MGRLYGFRISSIADKLWFDVFRKDERTEHTGNYYYVGTKDEEGRDRGISDTLHPSNP